MFHTFKPSKPPTSAALLLGVQGRAPSCSLPLNSWLTPGGSRWPLAPILAAPPNQHPRWLPYLPRLWTPQRRVGLEVGGMAILQPHLVVPSLLLPRPMSVAVPAIRMGLCFWLALDEGWLSHSISPSKVAAVARALWWASLALVRLLSLEASLPLGVLFLRVWPPVDLGSHDVCGISLHSCPWQSPKEDTTSAMSSGSLDGDPVSLQSLYTL